MLHTKYLPSERPVISLDSASELLESTSRNLILAAGGVYLIWLFFAALLWPDEWGWKILLLIPVIVLTCALPLALISRNILFSQLVWQVGLAGTITLAIYLFQQPELAFFYALLPLMAVITLGWPAGLLAETSIMGLVWWISASGFMPPLSGSFGTIIIISGILAGLLGWATINTLLIAVEWYLLSFTHAQQNMEAAQQSRAQLTYALKDLDSAYFRLQRSNTALMAARKAAEEANRFKAEFVTNVSHELRTPLNLIAGFSEVMLSSPESYNDVLLPGVYRSDLNAIYHSAQHLLALADDILDLARIEVGKISLSREETNLADLITETTGMIHDYIAAKGLNLQTRVAVDLPPVWIDRLRIREVLLNLLVNAARFTENGWIKIEALAQPEEILVRITDTGKGIAREDLPRIFEKFHTVEPPNTTFQPGTGLGLPISKRFVELHGGRMAVESTPLQGTTFSFTLPCSARPQPKHPHSPEPIVRLESPERVIVVVHDDPQIASLMQRNLGNCQVVNAPDLTTGITQAEELQAVAVITALTGQLPPTPANLLVINCPLPKSRRLAASLGQPIFWPNRLGARAAEYHGPPQPARSSPADCG
jgi:signal transduction histidine kinase